MPSRNLASSCCWSSFSLVSAAPLILQHASPFMCLQYLFLGATPAQTCLEFKRLNHCYSFLAPGVLGTSWLGSPLSVISIHPSFPPATSHILFQSCIQVRPLAASKNCLCVRTPSEAKDGSSSFAGLCKKSGC